MKLERKIGDSRFKIDAKFADSDSEEELDEGKYDVINSLGYFTIFTKNLYADH